MSHSATARFARRLLFVVSEILPETEVCAGVAAGANHATRRFSRPRPDVPGATSNGRPVADHPGRPRRECGNPSSTAPCPQQVPRRPFTLGRGETRMEHEHLTDAWRTAGFVHHDGNDRPTRARGARRHGRRVSVPSRSGCRGDTRRRRRLPRRAWLPVIDGRYVTNGR